MLNKLIAIAAVAALSSVAVAAPYNGTGFAIRNGAGNVAPVYAATSDGITASVILGSQKVGYGTNFFDGMTASDIGTVTFDRSDTGNSVIYSNVWVTNGTEYALLTPRNVFGQTNDAYSDTTENLGSIGLGVYGRANGYDAGELDWLVPGATRSPSGNLLKADGSKVTLSDLTSVTVGSPSFPAYTLAGGGDPKAGFGFQLIFGDYGSNFSDAVPYSISNVAVAVVPEPTSLALLSLGGLAAMRRRRA